MQRELNYVVDIGQRIIEQPLNEPLFTHEQNAHAINVTLKRYGEDVQLSGAAECEAYILHEETQVSDRVEGSIEGNVVTVVIPPDTYLTPGFVRITLLVTEGEETLAVLRLTGTIKITRSSNIYDPSGQAIPDTDELIRRLQDIEEYVDDVEAFVDDVTAVLAPSFDPEDANGYSVGEFVIYNAKMYRCTAPHTGAWDPNHFEETTAADMLEAFDDEISDLKSQIVMQQATQPTEANNRIWFPSATPEGVEVPTWEEFSEVKSAVGTLNEEIFDDNALFDGVTKTAVSWTAGSIGATDGVPVPGVGSGGNMYIYSELLSSDKDIVVDVTSGYKARYFTYNKTTGAFISAIANQSVPVTFTLDNTKAYRVQFLAATGATVEQANAWITNIDDYMTISIPVHDAPITPDRLKAIGVQVVDITGWHIGYISPDTGAVTPSAAYGGNYHIYSDKIMSNYGYTVEASRNIRYFKYKTSDDSFVTAVGWQTAPFADSFPPSDEYYYRMQILGASTLSGAQEICDDIADYVTIDQSTDAEYGWIEFLPIEDVYIGDVQQRIYFNELARYNEHDGYFVVSASGATYPEITYTDRYIQFVPTADKDITVTISYYYKDRLAKSKTITAHCTVMAFSAKKIMFIGDSYTEQGGMVKWLKDHNGENVILYGTRETTINGVTYKTEGRSGWTAGNYLNSANVGSVTNPFYNPTSQTFDFSYYMANAGSAFTDVQIVNILLGRNSGFPISNMDNLDTIVASIKAYNPNITVILMCDNNLAANNTAAGKYMQNVHTADRQSHIYNAAFYERYKDSASVVMCYQNLNIDNVYDWETEQVDASIVNNQQVTVYKDNVHPAVLTGQQKFGIALNGLLRNILN